MGSIHITYGDINISGQGLDEQGVADKIYDALKKHDEELTVTLRGAM